jgi:RNA 2',3'-cyclic 3'-phosphodiesterase
MPESLRTFIAVELNSSLREALARIQKELKSSGADAKWVKPENIHLTLKFLGAIPLDKIETINRVLQDIADQFPAFAISLSQLGAFPKIEFPRVIWIDLKEGKETLERLAKEIEAKLSSLGFPPEDRAFQTHITLARIKSAQNRLNLVKQLKETDVPALNQKIDKITFFKSTLTPKGPVYEVLKEIILKAS